MARSQGGATVKMCLTWLTCKTAAPLRTNREILSAIAAKIGAMIPSWTATVRTLLPQARKMQHIPCAICAVKDRPKKSAKPMPQLSNAKREYRRCPGRELGQVTMV